MAEEGVAAGGVMDISTALQEVVSSTLIHSGLACGTQEAAKAFDKLQAHLCVLAPNCDEPMHVKLVEAPCAEHQVNLIKTDDSGKPGDCGGLCETDRERKLCKVSVMVTERLRSMAKNLGPRMSRKSTSNARNE